MAEPLGINLAYQPLHLWECGICYALTLQESKQQHMNWHAKEDKPDGV
jgi:hypothetical protein